jgi:hypothetical protein
VAIVASTCATPERLLGRTQADSKHAAIVKTPAKSIVGQNFPRTPQQPVAEFHDQYGPTVHRGGSVFGPPAGGFV